MKNKLTLSHLESLLLCACDDLFDSMNACIFGMLFLRRAHCASRTSTVWQVSLATIFWVPT